MNKTDLIKAVAQRSGLTQKAAGQALDALVAVARPRCSGPVPACGAPWRVSSPAVNPVF